MKKMIVRMDDSGNLRDENGTIMLCTNGLNYDLREYEEIPCELAVADEQHASVVTQLISMGITPEDLIKLRGAGII